MGYTEQNSVGHAAPMVQVLSKEHIRRALVVCFTCHPGNSEILSRDTYFAPCLQKVGDHIPSYSSLPVPAENWLTPGAAQVKGDIVPGICTGTTLSVSVSEVVKPDLENKRILYPQSHLGFELGLRAESYKKPCLSGPGMEAWWTVPFCVYF